MVRRLHWLLAGIMLFYSLPVHALPELRIGLLWGTEENDNCVTQVHYILQILNDGDEPSGPFSMHVVFDAPELPPLDELGLYKGISHLVEEPIEPNGMYQIELWWKEDGGVPEGDWTSWMHIDIYDDVAEENEENNSEGPIYLHTETILCDPPNLFLDALEATVDGTEISYQVTAANSDVITVPYDFRVDLYVDRQTQPGYYDEGDKFVEFEGIEKGAKVTLEHTWDPGEDGVYMAYAVVDGWNNVFETTEADNVMGPVPVVVCTSCPDCVDGEPVDGACKCGGEPVGTGYCCGGLHIEDDCASLVEEAAPEQVELVSVESDGDVVAAADANDPVYEVLTPDLAGELVADVEPAGDVEPAPKKSSSGGCSVASGRPATLALLLVLLSVVLAIRRRVT